MLLMFPVTDIIHHLLLTCWLFEDLIFCVTRRTERMDVCTILL